MDFYLGIDIGTSRVKAVLLDERFQACASAAQNTGLLLSANGDAEQDMAQLWQSVVAILRDIARHPALQNGRLRAIGLAARAKGVVQRRRRRTGRPGILWSDTRSRDLMSELLSRPGFDRRFFDDTGTHRSLVTPACSHAGFSITSQSGWRRPAIRFSPGTGSASPHRRRGAGSHRCQHPLLNQQSGKLSTVVLNERVW